MSRFIFSKCREEGYKEVRVLNILRNILNEWKIIRPRRITQSAKFFISYRKRRIEELLIVKPECVLISAFYVKFRDGEKFKWQVAKSRQEMGSWSRLLGNYIIWHYINSFGLDRHAHLGNAIVIRYYIQGHKSLRLQYLLITLMIGFPWSPFLAPLQFVQGYPTVYITTLCSDTCVYT